ncbi:MAG: heavy metal translocating P-type ATPase, partial [Clostridiales bacterium]|nr:heavy metal translocating P-type ATPase [Clostridiales bacterium]
MRKEYFLQGLGCADCAAKIEAALRKAPGIASASLNFVTATLVLETRADYGGDLSAEAERIVHKYEANVLVVEKESLLKGDAHLSSAGPRKRLIPIISGAALLTAGLVLTRAFALDTYITLGIYLLAYLILGGVILLRAGKNILRGRVFDENFLMGAATLGALLIGEYPEAVAVMLFYRTGEFFQDLAVRRSKKSIAGLMDIRPAFAVVKREGVFVRVAPESVRPGEIILVRPGERMPLDGVVVEGESALDVSALTGESLPRYVVAADEVFSGSVNQSGVLTVEVRKKYGESSAAKIIALIENAATKKAPSENFITAFSRYYTPVVVALAALLAVIPPLIIGGDWSQWIHRGLVFLVISCPCALVISIPLGFFGGIGGASRRGILVKGGNYLEALNNLDIVVFDKTGTLTKG